MKFWKKTGRKLLKEAKVGAAAADRTPTPKSVTESPNTKRTRTVQILSHSQLYNSQA